MFLTLCKRIFYFILIAAGIWLTFDVVARILVESFWFQEIGYPRAFWLRFSTRVISFLLVFTFSMAFLWGNLQLAHRLKYKQNPRNNLPEKYPLTGEQLPPFQNPDVEFKLRLRSLLPILLGLAGMVELMVLYYSQTALKYWPRPEGLPLIYSSAPRGFDWQVIWQMIWPIDASDLPKFLGLLVGASLLLFYPQMLWAIAGFFSIIFSLVLSNYWEKIWFIFKGKSFGITEPLFHQDISFYIFKLPFLELLEFWLKGLFLGSLIVVLIVYLLSGNSLSDGEFSGFSPRQRGHLYGLSSLLMTIIAGNYWLSCYRLLYSPRGVAYGASFTDVNAQLPAYILLSVGAGAIAIFLLSIARSGLIESGTNKIPCQKIEGDSNKLLAQKPLPQKLLQIVFGYPSEKSSLQRLRYVISFYILVIVVAEYIWPYAVQRFMVQPNELQRENPYLQRSIAFTRQGFGLDNIDVRTFDPKDKLTYQDIQNNDSTIRNIRLWDSRPLLQTNRQLQQIRLYYKFSDADIDRYTLKKESPSPQGSATEKQQVLIAARELDYNAVPEAAKTWVNEHLVYTHGYGFTLSPVNTVGPGGLPDYFVKDIGVGTGNNQGMLGTSSERIRASIPTNHPRIYYGELTNTYVMAPSDVREFDYPSGDENVYNTYDGNGGVSIGTWWRRLVFAKYLQNWQMALSRYFTPETKVLFRRNIRERIQLIAPFLQYDNDPYLVVANTRLFQGENGKAAQNPAKVNGQPSTANNYLYWIVDAYTTSDRYPYSEPGEGGFNYIRNSVKVVIDAYNGSVSLYVADPTDPIIATWQDIFPNLFQPLDTMPLSLRVHLRYPEDFFAVQSERLLTYHMTDPQVFYNREDQWQIPQEIYGNEQQRVQPYYLIIKFPKEESEEFILLHPFTPTSRNNLIGWLAGRADGDNYGKLLLYQFPKQQLIYGPEQVEARINQDPVISQQISLWTRQGSRAIQGNLLVIPIEQSLLYVEPLYLEAEQNSLPTLARVIVVYENQIAMAETLDEALKAVFDPAGSSSKTTIIRPVEEEGLQ
jgi:uncharacterized membrane protein (UPF0182 family)